MKKSNSRLVRITKGKYSGWYASLYYNDRGDMLIALCDDGNWVDIPAHELTYEAVTFKETK